MGGAHSSELKPEEAESGPAWNLSLPPSGSRSFAQGGNQICRRQPFPGDPDLCVASQDMAWFCKE